jgi:hypothetical protein
MFALVENNEFVKILNDRKGFIGTADNIEIVWEDRTRTVISLMKKATQS